MTSVNASRASSPADRDPSLWLALRYRGRSQRFEFPRGGSLPIVVGSLFRAELRIDRRAIAPVHFQFERRDDHIWLIPSPGIDLLVNQIQVAAPAVLPNAAVIDFLGERVSTQLSTLADDGAGTGDCPVEALDRDTEITVAAPLASLLLAEETRLARTRHGCNLAETGPLPPQRTVRMVAPRLAPKPTYRAAPASSPDGQEMHVSVMNEPAWSQEHAGHESGVKPPGAALRHKQSLGLLLALRSLGELTRSAPVFVSFAAILGAGILALALVGITYLL